MTSKMTLSTLRVALLPALVVIALAIITAPVMRWLWGEWMSNEYYSHGILIPPVSLYLIYQRIRLDRTLRWEPGRGALYGLALIGAGLLFYFLALDWRAFYLATFSMIAIVLGLLWVFGGTPAVSKLWFPILFLALMVPLPLLDRTTLPLALFTGVCSGAIVQFFGLDITVVGNSITMPNANLVVGAQCSGVNSLIALTSLMVLTAYLVSGPIVNRLFLIFLAIPIAVIGNIVRVASLLVVARFYGAQAAFIFYH
ncbi:MAG: exosortase/archaeosortase family protein, partial [Litorilinea sp.]